MSYTAHGELEARSVDETLETVANRAPKEDGVSKCTGVIFHWQVAEKGWETQLTLDESILLKGGLFLSLLIRTEKNLTDFTGPQGRACLSYEGASALLSAERESSLFVDFTERNHQLNYGSLERTWLSSFFQVLTEDCRVPDLEHRLASVALVIFNYDRCIEHFLYYALQNYYGIGIDKAASLLNHLDIYHPYGTVGSFLGRVWRSQSHLVRLRKGSSFSPVQAF